jgi:hypothetical protein
LTRLVRHNVTDQFIHFGIGQVVLGAAETAFSRFAKPIRGGGIILRHALASSIRPR